MTEAILAHRGMINDFVGDAIMATFGAPVGDPEHALHAVQSAVAMERALHDLNRRWEAEGRPTLRMGVAVHTGEVFAGNVGGSARLKYAVVGDAVNVAARLEGLNKELGTTLLITEATRLALGGRVDVKDRGTIGLRGRTEPLRVHEVLGVSAEHETGPDRAGASTPQALAEAGHGAGRRRLTMRGRLGVVGTVGLLLWAGSAWAAEPVAVLTEIRPASGNVRVKLAGDAEWKVPQPLLSLRPGDQVRVLGDGQAVLVLTGGQGALIVSQANSPFTVQLPADRPGVTGCSCSWGESLKLCELSPGSPPIDPSGCAPSPPCPSSSHPDRPGFSQALCASSGVARTSCATACASSGRAVFCGSRGIFSIRPMSIRATRRHSRPAWNTAGSSRPRGIRPSTLGSRFFRRRMRTASVPTWPVFSRA